ncbi:hypothetical protein C1645_819518 [Glomus cerebriforme]|uniref:non-specific serine/threonine protein kinase n=1 Tax=Glomus cerebriforme TaxID=658196 RepID=A0A397TEE2_9GLOM|nr:hypothetical protein C1645_819518 [Glomus cerebriforme]
MVLVKDDEKNYGKKREQITELHISDEGLTGELNLTGFSNLIELDCSYNQLTSLDFLNDLNILNISNNRMVGLRELDISDTDIKSGLEYLPGSIKKINCLVRERSKSKVKLIAEKLGKLDEFMLYKNSYLKIKELDGETIKQIKDYNCFNLTFQQRSLIKELVSKLERIEEYKKDGLCPECQQNWTSGNKEIDEFIQKSQLEVSEAYNTLEWIPYEQFTDVEHLADGGFRLVHRDLHSGNVLGSGGEHGGIEGFTITDLGLCRPVNVENKTEVYGQIPYVAPEILEKDENEPAPYTQASDVYSFGMVAYELLANCPPYNHSFSDMSNQKRTDSLLIEKILDDWHKEILVKENIEHYKKYKEYYRKFIEREDIEFYKQYKEIKEEYNKMSQKTKYPPVNLVSKLISSTKKQNIQETNYESDSSEEISDGYEPLYPKNNLVDKNICETTNDFELDIETDVEKPTFTQYLTKRPCSMSMEEVNRKKNKLDIEMGTSILAEDLISRTKRQLSSETQTKTSQGDSKLVRLGKLPTDANFCAWLRDEVKTTPTELLNDSSRIEDLREQFKEYQQFQTNIEQPPK